MRRAVVSLVLAAGLATGCTSQSTADPPSSPSPAPPTASSTPTPVHGTDAANRLGVKWIPTPRTMPESYLRQLAGGATWDRVPWCQVEPRRGRWDWARVDDAVRQAHALGYSMMLKVRVGTCWVNGKTPRFRRPGNGDTESRMPASLSAYESFVRAVVSRYAPMGVHEYAVENEPNAPNFWIGTVDQLVTMTRTAAKAIRAADPKARVVSWGLASEPYGVGTVSRLLDEGHGAQAIAAYDAYFAHRGGYPRVTSESGLRRFLDGATPRLALQLLGAEQRLIAEHVFDVRQVHFYETWQSVPALMSYLHATTPSSVPIEVWEAGQFWQNPPSDARLRSDQAIKTVVLLLAGGASRIIWLPLTSDPRYTETHYGLLAPGSKPRAAADAYLQLLRWTSAASGSPVAVQGWRGLAFPHGSATWLVVWNDNGATVGLPAGTSARATDMSGHQVPWPSSGLRVGQDPLFVEIDASPSRAVALFS